MRTIRIPRPLALVLAATVLTGSALAAPSGAIYTTNMDGTIVNQNIYTLGTDVYLSGGPQNKNSSGLTDGTYYFQVTDPSGQVLLSTDNAICRQLVVTGGRVTGVTGPCPHALGTFNPANGATPVQLAPFSVTPNPGGEYKAWAISRDSATISGSDPKVLNFKNSDSKTDNFKVLPSTTPPQGSCQASSSLSALVQGSNVTSYVPKGNWYRRSFSSDTGISAVNIEGSSITPTLIPTANVVNSCASNSTTGTTVCTANNTDVYLLTGTTLSSTLTSGGSSIIGFSGGICTNCGVAMDAVHNNALISLSVAGVPGFQFLNLAGVPSFSAAFPSQAPGGQFYPVTKTSEDPMIDPTRHISGAAAVLDTPGGPGALLLSASEFDNPTSDFNNFEIIDVTNVAAPAFFENLFAARSQEYPDSTAEDCSTGIVLASFESSLFPPGPERVFIADLTQAAFTAGTPGTWAGASQIQTLTGSLLVAEGGGIAVAQGTHTGIVSGEFGGNVITAMALPSTSGTGTPAISDWVTCSIPGFSMGDDPHTLTAYQSPNGGDAIALLANVDATTLARVDLTLMLGLPRISGFHLCAGGTLPSTVVSFIPVP